MPPERREFTVPKEKVQAVIEQGKSKGWTLISQQQQDGTVLLTFEHQADASSPPTKKPFWKGPNWLLIGILVFCCVFCCGGFSVFALLVAPSDEEIAEMQTVEAQERAMRDTQRAEDSATEIAAQNATATIIALTPTVTLTWTPTMTNTPLPTETPTPLPPTATVFYEPAADAQGRVPDDFQAMMTAMVARIRAVDGVINVSQHTVMYDGDRPDGYFTGFKIEAEDGANEDEQLVTEIRQAIRNVLFEFYGSYPYLGVALTVNDGDELIWTWGSDDEIWFAQNPSTGDTVFHIEPTVVPTAKATQSLDEIASSIIRNTVGTELRDSDVEMVIANDRVVTLRYHLRETGLPFFYKLQADTDFVLLVCNLRKNGFTTQTFQFSADAPVTDSFGNKVYVEAVEMILAPETAARINCDNPKGVVLEDIAERYTVNLPY